MASTDLPLPDMEIEFVLDPIHEIMDEQTCSEILVHDRDEETGNRVKFAYSLKYLNSEVVKNRLHMKYKVSRVRRIG